MGSEMCIRDSLPRGGTSTALTLLYLRVLRFLDSKSGAVRLLAIDFAKAFDKLPHKAILKACLKFELPMSAIEWIRDFLTSWRQCVRVNLSHSTWFDSTSGVPQGSIIGPLLFCMVIDDFRTLHVNSSVIKYADDLTIMHFIRKPDDDKTQSEWDNVV